MQKPNQRHFTCTEDKWSLGVFSIWKTDKNYCNVIQIHLCPPSSTLLLLCSPYYPRLSLLCTSLQSCLPSNHAATHLLPPHISATSINRLLSSISILMNMPFLSSLAMFSFTFSSDVVFSDTYTVHFAFLLPFFKICKKVQKHRVQVA